MTAVVASVFPTTEFPAMPQIEVEWAPTTAPRDAPVWTSLAGRVEGFSTRRGRNTELEQYRAGKVTVLADSIDRLLDPSYASGPWAGMVVPNRQIRLQARWAGVTYDVITAFIDGYPQEYELNTTKVAIEATDGFKILAATDLVSAYELEMRKDQPTHWWPMSEAAGSAIATDSGYGTKSDGTYRFGSVLGNQPLRFGNPGSAEFSEKNYDGVTGDGPGMTTNAATACPASTTKWSIEFWGQWPGADETQDISFTFGETIDNTSPYSGKWVGIWSDVNTNPCYMRFWLNNGATRYIATCTSIMCDGNRHHVVVTYQGGTAIKIYWDGQLQATNSVGIPATFTPAKTYLNVGCAENGASYGGGTGAYNCDPAVYDGVVLTAAQVLAHYNAGANGFAGEKTGVRAGRILDQTAWPAARRTISTGVVNVGPHDWSGRKALDYLQGVAQTERAEFYIDTNGNVVWRDRNALTTDARSTTSQAIFGDSIDPADVVGWTTRATVVGNASDDVTDTIASTTDRYIRVVVTARKPDGAGYAGLALLELTAGGASPASASSPDTIWSGNVAAGAIDGSTGTFWQPVDSTGTATIVFDRGSTAAFTSVRQRFYSPSFVAVDYTIQTSPGELEYDSLTTDGGSDQIRNDVIVTRDGGVPQRAYDAASIEKNGWYTHTESGTFDETDATALVTAQTILARYKDPKLRITSIRIRPVADPDRLFPQVLGRKFGDRITVNRRPQDVGAVISADYWIEGIDHDVTDDDWVTTFQLVACV